MREWISECSAANIAFVLGLGGSEQTESVLTVIVNNIITKLTNNN